MSNNIELTYAKKNGYEVWDNAKIDEAMAYSLGYAEFISKAKIEREVVTYASQKAQSKGYELLDFSANFMEHDKFFVTNKNKLIAIVKIGKDKLKKGVRIVISHMDSPRLDLKPNPLFEDNGTAYLKTHYYGGIRKYQWLTTPLAMHGVVILQDGTTQNIVIGEDESDPVFYISDLLPHLAHEDDGKKLSEVFTGEKLNIICGGMTNSEAKSDAVKYNVLKMLNSKYGMVESDFLSAEIEFVPALKARDIGLDRAYIGAYGHDDKVCAYSALTAFLDAKDDNTCILYLVDKEEIGSDGVSGAQSAFISDILEKLADDAGMNYALMRQLSSCISADVTSAYDSNFKDVFEANNSSYLSCGIAVNKYTGARGKSGASDATAEFTSHVTHVFNDANVLWQAGEIGKVDCGGGGTVAMYLANLNIDTLDVGVPVMSMHSPYELISKVDLYSAYEAYKAYYEKA